MGCGPGLKLSATGREDRLGDDAGGRCHQHEVTSQAAPGSFSKWIQQGHRRFGEIRNIAGHQRQAVDPGRGCNQLVDGMLVVGNAQASPEQGGLGIEGQDAIAVLLHDQREPVVKQPGLDMVSLMPDEIHPAPQLTQGDDGQVECTSPLGSLQKKA